MIRILWNYKKILKSALVMQNIKKLFILFLRIIHIDFGSSDLEPSALKRLRSISFCIP